tara:strand:- start:143822 stop:144829 length:1008 start_codon:yes stop_codon:yes gene_type:complete
MKTNLLIAAFTLSSLIACKEKETQKQDSAQVEETANEPATYAEISIKEGGSWNEQERTYQDGTFKNVDSLDLPALHTDHSWYIRYEGPGWENKNIAYRLYLDWRNAIDIFGKKADTLVLPYVGQDNFDSYHEPAPWGQDILKAGKSLGIGGYGRYTGDTIAHFNSVDQTKVKVANADAKSTVTIDYTGWKTGSVTTDLQTVLSIFPEGTFTKIELTPGSEIDGLATGIVKFKDIPLMQETSASGDWAYISTYGAQTLVSDEDLLGMVIFYKTSQLQEITDGPHDNLLIFKPTTEKITYYISGSWNGQKEGIPDEEGFKTDLDKKLKDLDNKGMLE